MSDDPIERAARALQSYLIDPSDAAEVVRIVLREIRVPSESMLEAAEDIAFPDGEDVWTGPKPEETWPVMIDRLLWEPKEKK